MKDEQKQAGRSRIQNWRADSHALSTAPVLMRLRCSSPQISTSRIPLVGFFLIIFLSMKVAQQLPQQTGATKAANYSLSAGYLLTTWVKSRVFVQVDVLADLSLHHFTETWGSGRCGGFKLCHLIKIMLLLLRDCYLKIRFPWMSVATLSFVRQLMKPRSDLTSAEHHPSWVPEIIFI